MIRLSVTVLFFCDFDEALGPYLLRAKLTLILLLCRSGELEKMLDIFLTTLGQEICVRTFVVELAGVVQNLVKLHL